jgi:hypothetical protein
MQVLLRQAVQPEAEMDWQHRYLLFGNLLSMLIVFAPNSRDPPGVPPKVRDQKAVLQSVLQPDQVLNWQQALQTPVSLHRHSLKLEAGEQTGERTVPEHSAVVDFLMSEMQMIHHRQMQQSDLRYPDRHHSWRVLRKRYRQNHLSSRDMKNRDHRYRQVYRKMLLIYLADRFAAEEQNQFHPGLA